MINTHADRAMKSLSLRFQLVAHQVSAACRLRLLPRKRYPGLTVVPLHRGLLSRFVGILGFGE